MGKRAATIKFDSPASNAASQPKTDTKPDLAAVEVSEKPVDSPRGEPSQFEFPVTAKPVQKPSAPSEPQPSHRATAGDAIVDTTPKVNYDGKMNKKLALFLVILLLFTSGIAAYTYRLYQDSQAQIKKLKAPQEQAKAEVNKLVEQVGKLITLPSETPTVATVTDVNKLKNQPFFAKAQNGDKVLIFTQAKKAILYNPKTNKIIEVSTVNIDKNKDTSVAGASSVVSPTPTSIPATVISPKPTN